MGDFHPTLVSDKLIPTVNFYEDHFGFIPTIENDHYVLLEQKDNPSMRIAVMDVKHECIVDTVAPIQGLMLNVVVKNLQATYDEMYMDGLEIEKGICKGINGLSFVVRDPNGVFIVIREMVKH